MLTNETLKDLPSATFSPESAFGATPCAAQVGPTIAPCGQALAPASRSVRPVNNADLTTSATCGPNSTALSASAALQSALVSRLQASLALSGSTLYKLTWKNRVTPSGRLIPALRGSVRRTSDKGCTGWPTVTVEDSWGGASGCEQYAKEHGNLAKCLPSGGLGYSNDTRPQGRCGVCQCTTKRTVGESCVVDGLAHSEIAECERCGPAWSGRKRFTDDCPSFRLDNAECIRRRARRDNDGRHDGQQLNAGCNACRPGPTNGFWRDADWLLCRDDRWRPVEPGTFPLAHGSAARVGRLRGYGNAINAPQATEIIAAYLSICL